MTWRLTILIGYLVNRVHWKCFINFNLVANELLCLHALSRITLSPYYRINERVEWSTGIINVLYLLSAYQYYWWQVTRFYIWMQILLLSALNLPRCQRNYKPLTAKIDFQITIRLFNLHKSTYNSLQTNYPKMKWIVSDAQPMRMKCGAISLLYGNSPTHKLNKILMNCICAFRCFSAVHLNKLCLIVGFSPKGILWVFIHI